MSRRQLLRGALAGSALGVSGCIGGNPLSRDDSDDSIDTLENADSHPPISEKELYIHHGYDELSSAMIRGVVRRDGIPSIDDPSFISVDEADLNTGEPVFGLDINGTKRAYSHRVLVRHEVVNDEVNGDNIAVTYCPLTATPMGFYRGETELGVSGHLLNSNLVMWDRSTESLYPQILGTGLEGAMKARSLREFNLQWTTWGEWRSKHPDTELLSESTGFLRGYGRDPYGSYNPIDGYYNSDDLSFPVVEQSNEEHPKEFVIGTRNQTGALAFNRASLQRHNTLTGIIGDENHVAVADHDLGSAYVYRNPEKLDVNYNGDNTYRVNGDNYAPDELPLSQMIAFNAFWFAWYAFYPDTGYIR